MSVCIVAEYPWTVIKGQRFLDSRPGVVVCSDTRATENGRKVLPWSYSKQFLASRSIVVCYTSSHGAATTLALRRADRATSVKRIGQVFREVHNQFGGLTELLVVVWQGTGDPTVLELMPPDYRPRLRTGIIGIGDRSVLSWFQKNFEEDPTPDPSLAVSDEVRASLARCFPNATWPEPRFTVQEAAARIGGALAVGIDRAGGATVGLPIQLMIVQAGDVQTMDLAQGEKSSTQPSGMHFRQVTAEAGSVSLPAPMPIRIAPETGRRRAVQLFS